MKKFRSVALWPKGHIVNPYDNDTTKDKHDTKTAAEAVCRTLEREGLGGEGLYFPIRTWIEEIEETET